MHSGGERKETPRGIEGEASQIEETQDYQVVLGVNWSLHSLLHHSVRYKGANLVIVAKRISFDSAHFLPGYPGKCANMHGHHWVVELGVEGKVKSDGMVVDFAMLKEFLDIIKEQFDHRLLNNIEGLENPTAEAIVSYIHGTYAAWSQHENISGKKSLGDVRLAFIKVWETEDSYAEVRHE